MHCGARMMTTSGEKTVTHGLTRDHAHLDVLFDDATRLAATGELDAAGRAFAEFARELDRHIDVEERILFPAFDACAHMPGPTTVMRHEHGALKKLVATAKAALAHGDVSAYASVAAELAALVHTHNMKEERVLYPRCDGALDAAARAEVLAALRR
jgi:hemerythrin-like domain-containing protein